MRYNARMKRYLSFMVMIFVLSGCGSGLSSDQKALLSDIAQDIESIRSDFAEIENFRADMALAGDRNFFSYLRKENKEALIMNSSVYWFKVSLTNKAVDMMDSPQPVLSVEFPETKKHLHLRVRGRDQKLTTTLAQIVLRNGEAAGGIQRLYKPENAVEQLSRARKGRLR